MPVNSIEGKPTSEEFDKSIYGNEECKEDELPTLTSSPIKKNSRKGKSKKSYKPYLSYGITMLTPIAKSKIANNEKTAQKVKPSTKIEVMPDDSIDTVEEEESQLKVNDDTNDSIQEESQLRVNNDTNDSINSPPLLSSREIASTKRAAINIDIINELNNSLSKSDDILKELSDNNAKNSLTFLQDSQIAEELNNSYANSDIEMLYDDTSITNLKTSQNTDNILKKMSKDDIQKMRIENEEQLAAILAEREKVIAHCQSMENMESERFKLIYEISSDIDSKN